MYLQLREIQFTTISFLVIHSFMDLTQSQTTELAAAAARLEGQSWGYIYIYIHTLQQLLTSLLINQR